MGCELSTVSPTREHIIGVFHAENVPLMDYRQAPARSRAYSRFIPLVGLCLERGHAEI